MNKVILHTVKSLSIQTSKFFFTIQQTIQVKTQTQNELTE